MTTWESNSYVTDDVTWPWKVKVVPQYSQGLISWKRMEIETWVQWTTNRKWPIGVRMVTWTMTSRDPEWSRSWHCVTLKVKIGINSWLGVNGHINNKKAQLSLTNPRDAKACQKLLQFDVLTTLSLTILAYSHSFSCCCVRNLRNSTKFTENSSLWSSRSTKVIDLGVNRKPMYDFLLVTNSNFGRICYRFRDIHG